MAKIDCYFDHNRDLVARDRDLLLLCSAYVWEFFGENAAPGKDVTVEITGPEDGQPRDKVDLVVYATPEEDQVDFPSSEWIVHTPDHFDGVRFGEVLYRYADTLLRFALDDLVASTLRITFKLER